MQLERGQIVQSRKGRDNTNVYVVLAAENGRILVADGEKRTLLCPKHKNASHLNPSNTVLTENELVTDHQLRVALKAFVLKTGSKATGG